MSLINDALKRASAAAKTNTPEPTVSIRIRPVEEERRPSLLLMLGVPLLVVAVLLSGGWYYFYGRTSPQSQPAPLVTKAAPANPAPTVVAPGPVAVAPADSTPEVTPLTPPPASDSPATAAVNPPPTQPPVAKSPPVKAPTTGAVTASKTPPTFPALKLQGIYYRRSNPTAMINSQNVGIGETVDGVKVVGIERMSVTVELEGHKKVLGLQ